MIVFRISQINGAAIKAKIPVLDAVDNKAMNNINISGKIKYLNFVILSGLKIKGFTALQVFQLWRLIQFLKNSGRFSQGQFGQTQGSSSVTNDEAYKLLGLKKGCTKEDVLKAANQLQKKIHPDMNRDVKTERLSQLVNEAKEKIIKTDFS